MIQEANQGGNSGHPYRGYLIVNRNIDEADDEEPDILSEVKVSSHKIKTLCAINQNKKTYSHNVTIYKGNTIREATLVHFQWNGQPVEWNGERYVEYSRI